MSDEHEVMEETEDVSISSPTAPLDKVKQRSEEEEDSAPSGPPARIREMMAMFGSFGPAPSPLAEKVTTEHIDKMLDLERHKLDHAQTDRSDERKTAMNFGVLAVLFVLALVAMFLFTDNAPMLPTILSALIGLVAGALGGYGLGKSRA